MAKVAQNQFEGVLFLHLSDIHFSRAKNDVVYGVDENVRHELELDLAEKRQQLGLVDAILVSGDIAFSGRAEQYENAHKWLKTLCGVTGCEEDFVWIIPGNHDIDRKAYEDPLVEAVHERLRHANNADFDQVVENHLKNETSRNVLYAAQKNYRNLAKRFKCLPAPGKLYWEQDLLLNDGSVLRIRGVNSALVCDGLDNDEGHRLAVGSVQWLAPRDAGVAYLYLSHHPPDWLKDRDRVDDHLRNRARVQLVGHKHRQRIGIFYENLRLAAGAVNPDTREPEWVPRYNLFRIKVEGADANRKLIVDIYPRVWNAALEKFEAERDDAGNEHHRYPLNLPAWTPSHKNAALDAAVVPASVGKQLEEDEAVARGNEAVKREFPVNVHRRLTYRFLSLPHHTRLEIATLLRLVRDEDEGVDDAELFRRVFVRAKDENILDKLTEEVDRRYVAQ
jgi:calcineurin-like phosphoesterase family protein